MLRFCMPLIAVLTYALATNIDECTFGESFWCSSLENAKTCGAIGHCKSTVWQKEILKLDDDVLCTFCVTVIKDVERLVKENKTEQEVMTFLTEVCQMIPDKSIAGECQTIVQTYVPTIIELVTSEVEPRVICSLMKMCTGLEDKVSHPKLPVSEVKPQLITKFSPLPINSEPICTDCQKFFTDIKNMVVSNATEQEIETLVDQTLCGYLGQYEQMCKDMVKQYLPEIMQLLSSDFDPKLICQSLGFCTQTMPEARTFFLKLKLMKSKFFALASSANSDEGCSMCKIVMKDIQDLDRNKEIQTDIENLLKKQVCERFGNFKATCNGLIDAYGETMFELLATELDPTSRCVSWGFCAADNVIRDPVSTPVKGVAGGPECILCEYVMKQLDEMLAKNASKEEIKEALEQVCGFLPSELTASCDAFVTQYSEEIIDLLIQELDPSAICATLGLCSSSDTHAPINTQGDNVIRDPVREATPSRKPVSTPAKPVASSPQCVLCEFVMNQLEGLLRKNATEEEIMAALEKVCDLLPSSIRDSCDSFVEQYGKAILELLIQELDPSLICTELGFCSSSKTDVQSKVDGGYECIVCETVVQYLEALLEENATITVIESALEKVCNFLPDKFKSECNYFVVTYGALVVKFITTELSPKEICEEIGVCSNTVKAALMTEAKEVKTSQKLLGENECTWGPKHWCSSKENAAKCQATDFCEQTGWDF
jgi:saposin